MAKEPKPIIINNWQNGIAQSAELGFADIRNIDIDIVPGIALNSFAANKVSGTTITGLPMWAVMNNDTNSTVYVLDNGGKVYSSDRTSIWSTWAAVAGQTTTSAHGNGLALWNNYLFVARDTNLDVYGPLNGSPSWTAGWQTLNSDTSVHPMLVSTNAMLYGGNGPDSTTNFSNIFSLQQVASKTFAPGDATTYTWNAAALSPGLPYGYRVRCLTQLGNNLMIGTFVGTQGSSSDVIQGGASAAIEKIADIFPWDRTSAVPNLPIRLYEQGINQMLAINNILYIQAGQFGNFYKYNGYQASLFFSMPHNTTSGRTTPYDIMTFYPCAMMFHQGKIYFAMTGGGGSSGNSGVYCLNTDGSGLVMDNLISTGQSDGTTFIGVIFPLRDYNLPYLIGWQRSSAQGVDLVDGSNVYSTDYSSYIDTSWFELGGTLTPGTLQNGQIFLDDNLASGDGIRVSYRTQRSGSFTTLFTFDFATYGARAEYMFPAGNVSGRKAQFRIALAGAPRLQSLVFSKND